MVIRPEFTNFQLRQVILKKTSSQLRGLRKSTMKIWLAARNQHWKNTLKNYHQCTFLRHTSARIFPERLFPNIERMEMVWQQPCWPTMRLNHRSFWQFAFMQPVECDKFVSSLYECSLTGLWTWQTNSKSQKKRWAVDTARVSISQTVYSTRSPLVVQ